VLALTDAVFVTELGTPRSPSWSTARTLRGAKGLWRLLTLTFIFTFTFTFANLHYGAARAVAVR
jgi:hypothetical protein